MNGSSPLRKSMVKFTPAKAPVFNFQAKGNRIKDISA